MAGLKLLYRYSARLAKEFHEIHQSVYAVFWLRFIICRKYVCVSLSEFARAEAEGEGRFSEMLPIISFVFCAWCNTQRVCSNLLDKYVIFISY